MQMYDNAMTSIHNNLIQKSRSARMIYTAELIPEEDKRGEVWVTFPSAYFPGLTYAFLGTGRGEERQSRTTSSASSVVP
jgi:hypothetical protein